MKKLLVAIIAVAAFVLGTANVNAMTEEQLKEKLFASYNVGAGKVQLTDSMKNLVERYLDEFDVSEDAQAIADAIPSVLEALEGATADQLKDPTKLPASIKNDLKGIVDEVSATCPSVNVSLTADGLVINDPEGNPWEVVDETIKFTGNSNASVIYVIAGLVSLIGVSAVALRLKKVNA